MPGLLNANWAPKEPVLLAASIRTIYSLKFRLTRALCLVIFPLLSAGLESACHRHDPPVSVVVCTFEEMSTAGDHALLNTFNAEIKFLMRIFWIEFGNRKTARVSSSFRKAHLLIMVTASTSEVYGGGILKFGILYRKEGG